MTKRDTNNNEFLKHIYDLYDAILENNTVKKVAWRKRDSYSSVFKFVLSRITGSGRYTYEYNEKAKEVIENIEFFILRLSNCTPSFNTLWDFCEFVRISEKIFFYNNDPSNPIYVEMKFDPKDTVRKLRISLSGGNEIRLTLEKNLYAIDIITINVVRNFGLKMENTYRVTDSDMQYEDSSDIYMINEINKILRSSMISTLQNITGRVYSHWRARYDTKTK